jgi:DNA-binding transcriptional regulator YiaG
MTMTPKQLRIVLKRLGLTQVAAAHALGVAPRTMRQWIANDARIPEPAARLLATWVDHPQLLRPRSPKRR